jgi:hypothetical protein
MSSNATNGGMQEEANGGGRKLKLTTTKGSNQSERIVIQHRMRNRSTKLVPNLVLKFESRREGEPRELHDRSRAKGRRQRARHTLSS